MWRRFAVFFAAAVAAVTAGLVMPTPAIALPQNCAEVSISDSICTEWTGGWPGGQVRATTSPQHWAIRLDTCSSGSIKLCSNFREVARAEGINQPGYTSWVPVSKWGWYRPCYKPQSTSRWYCVGGVHVVYLGD